MKRGRLAPLLALAVAVLVATSCGEDGVAPEASPAEPPAAGQPAGTAPPPVLAGEPGSTMRANDASPARTWIRYENREAGYVVSYPSNWHRAEHRLTPDLLDPLEVLALATYPLRPGGDRCRHHPVNALSDLEPSDGFIALYERAAPFSRSGYPKRPRRLSRLLEDVSDSGRFCVPDPGRLDTWVSFSDGDRAFYLLVAIGEAVSSETRTQIQTILDSFRITG